MGKPTPVAIVIGVHPAIWLASGFATAFGMDELELAGGLLGINPYDQPAMQLGKDFTYGLMGKKGYEKQAKEYAAFAKKAGAFIV